MILLSSTAAAAEEREEIVFIIANGLILHVFDQALCTAHLCSIYS